MRFTVLYKEETGEIVYSTTLNVGVEDLAVAEFDVADGMTLVRVDTSKEEHVIIAEENSISDEAKLRKEFAESSKKIDALIESHSILEKQVRELTKIVTGGIDNVETGESAN
nr:MAG TPA: hypothetical protein [Caudoviricetes sp.]